MLWCGVVLLSWNWNIKLSIASPSAFIVSKRVFKVREGARRTG